jgi:hypothetical protein
VVISSSPVPGGRRARLEAERLERAASPQGSEHLERAASPHGAEVLESGRPRPEAGRPRRSPNPQVQNAPVQSAQVQNTQVQNASLHLDDYAITGSILLGDFPEPHDTSTRPLSRVQYPVMPPMSPAAPAAPQRADGRTQLARAAAPWGDGTNGPWNAGANGPWNAGTNGPRNDGANGPRNDGANGPTTTELGTVRSRRAAPPETSRRRFELALGRSLSNRRVWGSVLGVVLVLSVPGAIMLPDAVIVADGGLSGSASLTPIQDLPNDNREAQPEVDETSAADRARAKAKETAIDVAAAAEKAAAKATDEATKGDTKKTPTKTRTSTPSAGSTGRLNSGLSGLSWVSGVYARGQGAAGVKSFGDWRGATVDVVVDWGARQSWDDVIDPDFLYSTWRNTPYTKVFGIAPVPEADGSATMAGCAAGSYNDKWRQFGTNMKVNGLENETVIRLGWEFNGDWYKWKANDPKQFAECWRQIVGSAEETAPGLLWDWTVIRGKGKSVVDAREAYPGDAYVDIVGVDAYDMWPGATNEATWAEHYSGAYGLKFWSDFARAHGKKISVPEWAVYPTTASNGGDNAYFIEKMQGFFKAEGSHLAYEAYFNESASYIKSAVFSPNQNPNAAAKYQALFGS